MQIGYSSCSILQFVSRIDTIKIPTVYDVAELRLELRVDPKGRREKREKAERTLRDVIRLRCDRKDVLLRTRRRVRRVHGSFKGNACSFAVRFPARQLRESTDRNRWALARRLAKDVKPENSIYNQSKFFSKKKMFLYTLHSKNTHKSCIYIIIRNLQENNYFSTNFLLILARW